MARRAKNISIGGAIKEGAQVLREAGVAEARREASSLLAHAIGRDRTFIITHTEEFLPGEALETFRESVKRRAAGEPLQYISGHQQFFKLDFEVARKVLIPRPETELIVEIGLELLRGIPAPLIADVGTGSGCIAISLLHELADARAVATDISGPALRVARRNAEQHGVINRLMLMESDCLSALTRSRRFSLIVSNPPYIGEDDLKSLPREVRDYEPRAALVSGADGLSSIRRLLRDAPSFLRSGGHFVFEIGFGQREAVEQLIDARVWKLLEIRHDLQRIPRTVVLQGK
jgi:release factor glutamine methyltransferase